SAVLFLERMEVPESGQGRQALVDARVVLHRAGPERVEAGVDSEVPGRELGVVPEEIGLCDLRQARRFCPRELRRNDGGRKVGAGRAGGAPARNGLLVDQPHRDSTFASRSISAFVRRSVTATSRTSSIPG